MRKKINLSFVFVLSAFSMIAQMQREYFLLIGTYTSATSEGISVYKFNRQTGEPSRVSLVPTSNPSYLAVSPDNRFVYAVNEDNPGKISAFSFDNNTGQLIALNQTSSKGKHPCYITVDKTGKWVIAGNYSSGTIAVLPVLPDGSLGMATDSVQHSGKSVNTERQTEAHVHATYLSADNKKLYVPDLGMDKIMIYDFDVKRGKLKPAPIPFVTVQAGAGPRHIEIYPGGKFAYLMEELSGNVSAYRVQKNGSLQWIQTISALPRNIQGAAGSADIHISPDGKFLYCSNRGESNTLGIFKVDSKSGLLNWIDNQSTLGKAPRNFNFDPDGNFLLVANQNSDAVVIFRRDKTSGLLTDTGKKIYVSKPVCLKWIPAPKWK